MYCNTIDLECSPDLEFLVPIEMGDTGMSLRTYWAAD